MIFLTRQLFPQLQDLSSFVVDLGEHSVEIEGSRQHRFRDLLAQRQFLDGEDTPAAPHCAASTRSRGTNADTPIMPATCSAFGAIAGIVRLVAHSCVVGCPLATAELPSSATARSRRNIAPLLLERRGQLIARQLNRRLASRSPRESIDKSLRRWFEDYCFCSGHGHLLQVVMLVVELPGECARASAAAPGM